MSSSKGKFTYYLLDGALGIPSPPPSRKGQVNLGHAFALGLGLLPFLSSI